MTADPGAGRADGADPGGRTAGVERARGAERAAPTLGERLAGRALIGGVRMLQLLPEGLVYRAAYGAGWGLSFLLRARRRRLRANLRRVVTWLDAQGLADPRAAAAARNGRKMDALVRSAFGHWVMTYAESIRAPLYDATAMRDRVRLETPDAVADALGPVAPGAPGPLFVGLHFGSVEIAGLYAARLGQVAVGGPMETVGNPVMRDFFERTRRRLGVEVYPIPGVAPLLRARLAQGLGVALVADRVIGGAGSRVELFGVPSRIPGGPAMLAAETGARLCFLAVRRDTRPGRWIGRVEVVTPPAAGSRRERTEALMHHHARWIERTVATAPEQWWTLLFPVWEDIG